ncbi:MAG: hypothetical protein AB7Q00_08330 [Phycisphaerales bacterium]
MNHTLRAQGVRVHHTRWTRSLALTALVTLCLSLPGCGAGALFGGMLSNWERTGSHTVEPKYSGLEGKSFAILASAPRMVEAEYPDLANELLGRVAERLYHDAGASGFIPPPQSLKYMYDNPNWIAAAYGQTAQDLGGVQRLIVIEIIDYRLREPGNNYEWSGMASANVSVIEADSVAPDAVAWQQLVQIRFPTKPGYGPDQFDARFVSSALLARLTDRCAWLFYKHKEPNVIDY